MKKVFTKILIMLAFVFIGLSTHAAIWTQKANYGGTGRKHGPACFTIGTSAYVGLGNDGSSTDNYPTDFWKWDQTTNAWTQIAAFPGVGREGCIGFSLGTTGYVGMGYNSVNTHYYGDIWAYNSSNNTWAAKNNFTGGMREFATCLVINNIAYIGCGFYQSGFQSYDLNDFYAYNSTNDSWAPQTYFPGSQRCGAFGFVLNNIGYIGTGDSSYYPFMGNSKGFYAYDPASNTWAQKANFPGSGRMGCCAFALNNIGYAGLGLDNNASANNDFYKYDPSTDTWTQVANCGISDFPADGFNIGTKGYFVGGGSSTPTKAFWEYAGGAAGIEEISNDMNISIYPVPASTLLNIHQSVPSLNQQLIIIDIMGNEVYKENLTGIDNTISIANYSNGIYFYEVRGTEGSTRGKFVVQK